MDFSDDSGKVFKSREFPKEIAERTDEAFKEVEAALAGMEKGAEVAATLKSPLTQKVALMKLMLGHRFEKLTDTQGLEEAFNWKALAAAGALALPGATSNELPPAPKPKVVATPKKARDPLEIIKDVAKKYKLPAGVLQAMMGVESGGDHTAVSPKGARGLMQIMPATAKALGVQDPHDPEQGIEGAGRYLKRLLRRFKGDMRLALAAYNMGPTALDASIESGEEWPEETQQYVQKVAQRAGLKLESVALRDRGPTDLGGGPRIDWDVDEAIDQPNPHADMIGATIGRYQPFHAGHATIIRNLANKFQKVIVFVAGQKQDKKNPFSHDLRLELMKESLTDVWAKLEVYPAQVAGKGTGYVPGLLSWVGQSGQSSVTPGAAVNVLVGEDRLGEVQKQIAHNKQHMQEDGYFKGVLEVSALPGVKNDDDAGRISGTRVREALARGDRESVKKMLDPRVSSDEAKFEEMYAKMRGELQTMGLVEQVTEAVLAEVGMGALETGVGGSRNGGWGSSAWSRAWLAQDEGDAESMYQKAMGSPTRMLPMNNHPIDKPNAPLPGENSIEDDLNDHLEDPTDLDEAIILTVTRMFNK
jgi:cytidyltransferase-like protein